MKTLLHFGYCLLGATLLLGCSEEETDTLQVAHTPHQLPADVMTRLVLDTVQLAPARYELKLSGRVAPNADQTAPVYALAGGVVQQAPVSLGDQVKAGQMLAVVHSSQQADMHQQLTSATISLQSAQEQLRAAESMHADGMLSERDLAVARAEMQKARSEVLKQQKQASVYGHGADATYTLHAPIAGFVTEKKVTTGMQFMPESVDNLFTISNLDEVWVLADVFQADVAKVRAGQPVELTTLSYPGRRFTGTIDKVFNMLHAENKSMTVRVRLPNPDYALKPGMFARLTVHAADPAPQLAIPASSLVFANDRHYVLVRKDARTLETREVSLLHRADSVSYVQTGVAPGELVVSQNPLLLYKALND